MAPFPARYINCHFRDAIRQFAIDLMVGHPVNMATIDEHNIWRDIKMATKMVYGNLETDKPRLELVPTYFGHTLTNEFASAEIAYGLGRSVSDSKFEMMMFCFSA